MKLFKIMLLALTILLFFGCGKKSSTEPDMGFNENLIGYWYLVSYQDEDGMQSYTGFMEIDADQEMHGQFVDEDGIATFSGTVETNDTLFRVDIEQSNALWIEEGQHDFNYMLNAGNLQLDGQLDDEDVQLTYTLQDTNPDEYGILAATVLDNQNLTGLDNALVTIQNTQLSGYTDFDGNVSITNIPVGNHSVLVSKSGYETKSVNITITKDETTYATIQLQQQTSGLGDVSGFVADAMNQTPLSGATISILGTSYQTQSGTDGIYTFTGIPVGTYDFQCVKTGFEEQISSDQSILADEEIYIDFILLPEGTVTYGTLSGIITSSQGGTPIQNVAVQIVGLANSALSYNDGSYEVVFIPEGTYQVTFTKVGYETVTESNVAIENGNTTTLDCIMNPIQGTSSLIAAVTNSLGIPISAALIEIIGTGLSGTTGMGGICTIQNVPVGTYDVQVSKAGYATELIESVEFLSGIPRPLDIVLQNGK
jgi:hypothetical protein